MLLLFILFAIANARTVLILSLWGGGNTTDPICQPVPGYNVNACDNMESCVNITMTLLHKYPNTSGYWVQWRLAQED